MGELLVELSPLGPLSKQTRCQLLSIDLCEKIPAKVIGNSVFGCCCLCLYIFECMHEKRGV